ncbi:MAG TPA: NYN domain-containing protein [Thermoleophilaceae bacterium]
MRWLVDGMNVVGSRPDGWWRDRRGAMERLIAELEAFAEATGDEVSVVFDGRPFPLDGGGRVEVGFAPGGRNAADHAIADWVAADPEPEAITVVTSDAELERAVRGHGADVLGSGAFRRRLDAT